MRLFFDRDMVVVGTGGYSGEHHMSAEIPFLPADFEPMGKEIGEVVAAYRKERNRLRGLIMIRYAVTGIGGGQSA